MAPVGTRRRASGAATDLQVVALPAAGTHLGEHMDWGTRRDVAGSTSPVGGGRLRRQRVGPESKAKLERPLSCFPCSWPGSCTYTAMPASFSYQDLCACQSLDLEHEWWEEAGGGGGEGRGEEEVSKSGTFPSDQREGNTYNFPFSSLLCPRFDLGSFPSGLGMAWLAGQAGAGAQVPGQLGSCQAPSQASRPPLPGMPFSLSGRPHPLVFKVL